MNLIIYIANNLGINNGVGFIGCKGLSIALIKALHYTEVLISSNMSKPDELISKELVFNRNEQILYAKINDVYRNYRKYIEFFKRKIYSVEIYDKKYTNAYGILLK